MRHVSEEEPQGLLYRPDVISVDEEAHLVTAVEMLRFDPIVLHGREARRSARHFGLGYDYGARTPQPGEPMPEWLALLRERAAELAGVRAEELVETRRVWEVRLAPRSGYVLAGEARQQWQHSIPKTKELRYSITFRTLRRRSA